ncbi:MAG: nicotinate-nucleotide--dimethylbenzimidazole phosphoribosyltransferase [Dehalococcoidia bacterium]
MSNGSSLIDDAATRVRAPDAEAMAVARARQATLTKPPGSLGRLEDLAVWLAGVRGDARPRLERKTVVVAAADHGVARQGVSAYPQGVTAQMVRNFLRGGAAINALARQSDADVIVVDAGVVEPIEPSEGLVSLRIGPGTKDMTQGPAMTREQAIACLEAGARLAADLNTDAVVLGDMGIGNTTAAAALTAAFTDASPEAVCGPGTGLDEDGIERKIRAITRALDANRPDPSDPVGVLAAVGGFELGVLAGVVVGAAGLSTPVILDGYPTTAAALVATALCPPARDYLIASHMSAEPGHMVALAHLGLTPLLDLGLRLGEGTGGVLALGLLDAAARLHDQMATFDEAGVSGPR